MKSKVLDNVGDFNELYYIYKDKYNEEKELKYKKQKIFLLWKIETYWWLSIYESEKEEKEQQTSKKELLKKPTEEDESNFNEWVNKKETSINSEIFQRLFKFQRPSDMFKLLYKTNKKNKNKELVNMIKSGVSDLENEIENRWRRRKKKNQMKY